MATPTYVTSAKQKVVKSLPYLFGRFLQISTHGIFVLVRALGQVLKDAIGR